MKQKVKLYRRQDGRDYNLESVDINSNASEFLYVPCLCKDVLKKWFGLKRQLRVGQKIEGYLEVKFTPIAKPRLSGRRKRNK